jgi:hypothetical protein
VDGHRLCPELAGGCEGSDCVLVYVSRILFAFDGVQVVIALSAVDLSVNCTSPLC